MMKKIQRLGIFVVALTLVCALGLSLAYFTDRVEAKGSMSTADNSVDIDITKPDVDPSDPSEPDPSIPDDPTDPDFPVDPGEDPDSTDDDAPWTDPTEDDDSDDLENWWNALNATALANFNPGDKLCLDGKISNSGTLDIEYRQTFIVTTDTAMDTDNPEFRLFTSCYREDYGALTGGTVAAGESIDASGKKITYSIPVADLASGEGVHTNFDLGFDKMASNEFQGAEVTVDYILEACQDGADWLVVATATTTTTGGDTLSVVPKAE